jgi:hypothetical protein
VAAAKKLTPVPEPEPEPEKEKVFTFVAKEGDDREPIELPLEFDRPDFSDADDRVWLFDLREMPFHEQLWTWIRRAKLPRAVAHRIVRLPFGEQVKCVEGWLKAAQGVGAGES